ncbi:uncharacterized protein DUF4237 [Microbacterium sp. AG157]|uniref:TNT domain-containing protein n=1 Tax=Microbacterium sp. AG157 TaxID=2183993 RepID=UPI000E223D68|nr:TNT domain-containing protein [Microbacterium sp. AG157]REC97677.1 uncharacterized protein DUF4237 [Microbacterium sp. AG157]
MSNALVAGPVDTATPFSGAGLLDSGTQLASAIESGNWVEGGLAAFSTVVDTVATAIDPLGSLIAAGLGWLIDHFEPIKGWFNDLTGDAGAVAGFSQTWTNVQNQLNSSADYLDRVVSDLDDMAGEAIEAYRRFQTDAAAHIRASGQWAGAMATGLQIASTIVQVVHDLVRDILSQLVGSAISWATEAVVTVGIATPWIISQVSSRVASWTAKISGKLTGLLRSCGKLGDLLTELRALMAQGSKMFSGVLDKGKTAVHNAKEAVAALPGVRRLDPRRNKLVSDMEQWASNAHLPGYKPFGDLDGPGFIDAHLRRFTDRGYPEWKWPPSNGFDTSYPVRPASSVLQPGMSINRISPVAAADDLGEFASPAGVSFGARSVPPDRLSPSFSSYDLKVLKPLPPEVTFGRIAEAFEQPGGGVQFHFPGGIKYWIDNKFLG